MLEAGMDAVPVGRIVCEARVSVREMRVVPKRELRDRTCA